MTVAASEVLTAATKTPKSEYPLSKGYLVYESRRCVGCQTFMLICSLVQNGDATKGYPTRKTLEELGMKHVADVLQSKNRRGSV